jgi:squalene synthase HpnC
MPHYITLNEARNIKRHYENFPVASLLLPKKQRDAAVILYKYARECDDIADEGILNAKERMEQLKPYIDDIEHIKNSTTPAMPLFVDIQKVCAEFNIDSYLLVRLMEAFTQDIRKIRYENMYAIEDYCLKAACPAGEMILTLFNQNHPKNITYSNHLCIALAMIGMLQDIHEDYLKNRIYIPQDDFQKFNLTEQDIAKKAFTENWQNFKEEWLVRIDNHIQQGKLLETQLTGRLKLQIKVLIYASNLLIRRMRMSDKNLFSHAPKLSKLDWIYQFLRALISR